MMWPNSSSTMTTWTCRKLHKIQMQSIYSEVRNYCSTTVLQKCARRNCVGALDQNKLSLRFSHSSANELVHRLQVCQTQNLSSSKLAKNSSSLPRHWFYSSPKHCRHHLLLCQRLFNPGTMRGIVTSASLQSSDATSTVNTSDVTTLTNLADVPNTDITVSTLQPVLLTGVQDAEIVSAASETVGGSLLFPDFLTIRGAEALIQKLHDVTGLPWWCTVMLTAFVVRAALITPLSVYAQHNMEKLNSLQPQVKEVAERLKVEVSMAMHQFKWDEKRAKDEYVKNMKRLVKEMYISNNCHPMKNTASFWLQFPLWISVSYSLRNMSYRAVNPEIDGHDACQGLTQDGALWFPDLTAADSTWILPVMMGCVTLFNIEMTQLNVGEVTKYKKRLTYFLRGVALLFVPICSTMPSVMVLYWVTSGSLAATQNILLDYTPFRRLVGLPHSTLESYNPFRALVQRAKLKYLKQ